MSTTLERAIGTTQRVLASAEPERVSTAEAAVLVEQFAELERLGAAGRILFAARAAQSTVWVDEGHASAATWLAEQTRGPLGEAISAIETSKRLGNLDETSGALRAGKLSSAQVREVARAAEKDPGAERELLGLAEEASLKGLQARAREVLAGAASKEDEAARYKAIADARYTRHFTDHDGAFRLEAKITPDAGARVLSSMQAEADAIFSEARAAGIHERPEAYLADALVALLSGEARTMHRSRSRRGDAKSGSGRREPLVVGRIDMSALCRGFATGSETCEIAGVGPVPVATLRALLPEAWVKLVVTRGVDVVNVCHIGRAVSAHVDTALEERDRQCVVPGCDVVHGLQKHHWVTDFARSKTSRLSELARVCRRHHDMITYDGYVLDGGPGAWAFRAPPGTRPRFDDSG